jgi:two-component system, LytTR family, response regulator
MTFVCLIIEDEPLARQRLEGYLERLPLLSVAGHCEAALDALAFLKQHHVDLVLLDIDLGGVSGMQLLETSALRCPVILTTAHATFAARAYDFKVVDYLLKPFTFERFVQAIDRVPFPTAPRAESRAFFFVKTESRLERVSFDELLYIEGQGDYRALQLVDRQVLTLQTFADFERQLPPERLCRVHKSWMVAISKITSVEHDRVTLGGREIPISESYRDRFYRLLQPHLVR